MPRDAASVVSDTYLCKLTRGKEETMTGYKGKIAIVTGGGSGIGRTICIYLAERGAHVVAADRNLDSAQVTESMIRSAGGSAESLRVDVANQEEVESLIHGVAAEHGRIDYLFNNAGVGINGEFQDLTMEHLNSVRFNIYLFGQQTRRGWFLPHLARRGQTVRHQGEHPLSGVYADEHPKNN